MLSRLSGLANTVLHELSGDGNDGDPEASDTGQGPEPVPGSVDDAPEDVLERLAQTEQLVVHLKTLIREKDLQLQQKDGALKAERDLADVKLAKLKLQAKAKVASLNKQIEGLKKSAPVPLAAGDSRHTVTVTDAAESQELNNGQSVGEEQREELEGLKRHLSEQDTVVRALQDTVTGLREQLESAKALESRQAEQLFSLQEVISVKDTRFQELVQQHEEELRELTMRSDARLQAHKQQHEEMVRQLAEHSDAGANMQQTLRTLQRKQEEQEEALLGRMRVVEMLQQELQNADQQKQILSQQFQVMEAELSSLKAELDAEKQASNATAERLEMEVTDKEKFIVSLQGEVQHLTTALQEVTEAQTELVSLGSSRDEVQSLKEALEQARGAHGELESLRSSREEAHTAEVQSLTEALEQARRAHAELEMEKSMCEETQKEEIQRLARSEQLAIAHVEELDGGVREVEHREEGKEGDPVISQLLTKEEELHLACDALEARKKELLHEVDRKTLESDGLSQKIQNLQATLLSSLDPPEASPVPVMAAEDVIQNRRDEMITVCKTEWSTEETRDVIMTETAAVRSKQLSILMFDLKDAQEEISRLKNELPEMGEMLAMTGAQGVQLEVGTSREESLIEQATSQLRMEEEGVSGALLQTGSESVVKTVVKGQASSLQSEESGTSVAHMASLEHVLHEEEQTSRKVVPLESIINTSDESGVSQEVKTEIPAMVPPDTESQAQDWQTLQMEILRLQKSEDTYRRELEEQNAEINRLRQLVMEQSQKTEDHDSTVHVLMDMNADPSKVMGLEEELRRLEGNLADAEKGRLSDYESGTMQRSLLGEQIHSLKNESRSKDVHITALHKDLDQVHLQLHEQIATAKQLESWLHEKEKEVCVCEEHLKERLTKLEELHQCISLKEMEAAEAEQLLSRNAKEIESLRGALAEKDLQAAEISHSMSERMVLLNEEKFSLMNELKVLKKQLGSLERREEATDQQEKNEAEAEGLPLKTHEHVQLAELVETLQREREERECQLVTLRSEQLQLSEVVETLQGEREELQRRLQTLQSEQLLVHRIAETEPLQGQEKPLEQEEHWKLTERITSLQKEMEELQLQMETSRDKQLQESDMRATLQRERGELQAQLETLRSEPLKQDVEVIEMLRKDKEQLQIQLETFRNEHLQHGAATEALETENRELSSQLETLRKELLQQSPVTEALVAENRELSSQLEALRQEHPVGQGEVIEVLQKEKDELQVQLETVRNDIMQQGAIMETLQGEKSELLGQLETLRSEHLQQDEIVPLQHVKEEAPGPLEATGSEQLSHGQLKGKEELQSKLEQHKKENEQMKRKLQAALVNRKELMKKIDTLEKELLLLSGQSKGKELIRGRGEGNDSQDCTLSVEQGEPAGSSDTEMSLNQQLSEKELELQNAKRDLLEKAANEEKLQVLIKEVTHELQAKISLIESLKVEVLENQSIIQKLTGIAAGSQSTGTTPDSEASSTASGAAAGLQASLLESKISSLEQEKEQLQKKVQEALASRKDTIKKAQEKDRHHREQLKLQKEDYNLLQERFDEQNQHQEGLQEQLRDLQKEVDEHRWNQPQLQAAAVLPVSSEQTEPPQLNLQDSLWGHEWVEFTSSEVEDTLKRTDASQVEDLSAEQYRSQLEQMKAQKAELETQVGRMEDELAQKSGEIQQLQEHIAQLISNSESSKTAHREALDTVARLQLELDSSQVEMLRLEELKNLKPEIEEIRDLLNIRDDEKDHLNLQLREKEGALLHMQNAVLEKEEVIRALQTQLEIEARDHEEKSKRLQMEVLEVQQKQEVAEESKSKQQINRKLQAALISRKEALKESKSLKEELVIAKSTIEELSRKLAVLGSELSDLNKEKAKLLENSAALQQEREKLIGEVDRALTENQNLAASCESLKLALEGITQDKESLEKERDLLRNSLATEGSEWQEKHQELQCEYETLLQSYENVSNETERIQRVIEAVRQEKQELFSRMKAAEAQKKDVDKQLEEAEREMEAMKEKMRKFAKSKQQKILELEEENEKLLAQLHPSHSEQKTAGDASVRGDTTLKEELERLRVESEALVCQLQAAKAENVSLTEEAHHLKHQLMSKESTEAEKVEQHERVEEPVVVQVEEPVVVQTVAAVPTAASFQELVEETVSRDNDGESLVPVLAQEQTKPTDAISHDEINIYIQQISQLQKQVSELEETKRAMGEELSSLKANFQALTEERRGTQSQVAASHDELKGLHENIAKLEAKNREAREELVKVTKLKDSLEAEKDDLEERLMNQLAELNGSIGNYQQDATDFQSKNDSLESEVQSFQRRIGELEEEKRQLEREKREAEAKMQKEYMEKLKSVQTGERGRRTHAKELQELLREKQLEVKHLQKDCIRHQEKISDLERTVKALEFVQSESLKEQAAAKESLAKGVEERKRAQAELATFRAILDDTQSETARVLAESLKLKEELQASKDHAKSQMKKKDEQFEVQMEQERDKHTKEMRNMQDKLDALQREKDHVQGTLADLQDSMDKKNQNTKKLQGSLNENLAKLAAFTRSMSSLQDDRDRIIDESKKWEKKFTSTIQKKEQEIQAKEDACQVLKDQAKQMSIIIEELQIKVSRLEHDKLDWETKIQTKDESHQTTLETLQLENKGLMAQLEESQRLHKDGQDELNKLVEEVKMLRERLTELDNSFKKCESTKEQLEGVVKEMESEIQNYKFSCEQLQADRQASKDLTDKLHEEVEAKDQRILSLLAAKEEAVSSATAELLQQHGSEVRELEERLRGEAEEKGNLDTERMKLQDRLTTLTAKMKTIKEESKQHKARLDSFTRSMSSLQDDRDRVLEEYKLLEERHLRAILDKDQLIQEAATENNELKEEIRSFHSRMDDLNSENAKLAAQLVRYREDLNQVITLKDSQQKQLLKAQLEQIHSLGEEKATLERHLRDSVTAAEELKQTVSALQEDKQRVASEAETLTLCVSQLNDELTVLKGGGLLYELEVQLREKEKAVEGLSSELFVLQGRITELEETILCKQSEVEKVVMEMEGKHEKEMKNLQHDAGIMRNETETAEVRVAELARDLMEMEQRLLTVTEENLDLKAQVLAFGKSMSSLQDSRDQAEGALEELAKKYSSDLEIQESLVKELRKELAQLQEEHSLLVKESDSLTSELTSLKSSTATDDLLSQIEQLTQQLLSKEEEVVRLTSERDGHSTQLKSFSKAMGSLQDERDRLLSELDKQRKVEEAKQQSGAAASPAQVQSMKNALSSLQNDRDRLLKELKNLQQQYLRIGEETGDISQLKAQLQESRQQLEVQLGLQEQMRQDSASQQQELLGLREERMRWESQNESLKRQCLTTLADKDQQLSNLQRLLQEVTSPSSKSKVTEELYQQQASPESTSEALRGGLESLKGETAQLQAQFSDSLKQLHQKELRIQQLNSKLSQIFEEKKSLSIQLRGSSHNVRESQQRYNEALKHCAALEAQLQELQSQLKESGEPMTDAAPGAPQEKNEPKSEGYPAEMKELMLRLSEAQQHQNRSERELQRLEELLSQERDQRLAAEEALFTSEDQDHRLESSHWSPAQDQAFDVSPSHEHSLLIEPLESTFSKTRGTSRLKRFLHDLFYSRTRTPLLVAAYLLTVHVLLVLCFTGHL